MSPGYCDNGLRADGGYQFTSEASQDNKIVFIKTILQHLAVVLKYFYGYSNPSVTCMLCVLEFEGERSVCLLALYAVRAR